jgi:hypothetical protein
MVESLLMTAIHEPGRRKWSCFYGMLDQMTKAASCSTFPLAIHNLNSEKGLGFSIYPSLHMEQILLKHGLHISGSLSSKQVAKWFPVALYGFHRFSV